MTSRPQRVLRMVAATTVAAIALAACSGGGKPSTNTSTHGNTNNGTGGGDNSGYTIAMVTHETPGDTFWDRIRAGAQQAAKNEGITLKYSNDPDASKQAVLIQNAIDSHVDGIATTLATPTALKGAVQAALKAHIPVVAFNSGLAQYQQVGALMYFGSDETLAGQTAGKRLASEGVKHPLCTIQEAGQVALEARCAGLKSAIPGTEIIQVNGANDASVTSTIQAKLAQDKSVDAIVTLGAPQAVDALKSMQATNSKAKLVTFDLNETVGQDIQSGKVEFSIDQQPYVQGFMAVASLYLYIKNGNDIGGGKPVLTGPSYVDKSNINKILPFIKNNTR